MLLLSRLCAALTVEINCRDRFEFGKERTKTSPSPIKTYNIYRPTAVTCHSLNLVVCLFIQRGYEISSVVAIAIDLLVSKRSGRT